MPKAKEQNQEQEKFSISSENIDKCKIESHTESVTFKTREHAGAPQKSTELELEFDGVTVRQLVDYVRGIAVIRIQSIYRRNEEIPDTDTQNIADIFGIKRQPKKSNRQIAFEEMAKLRKQGYSAQQLVELIESYSK